jgi:S-adenosylmethionine:tRNA ribosyltransferase-isomerase
MAQTGSVDWHCLVGGASKWKTGQVLQKEIKNSTRSITLSATYIEKKAGSFIIELSWQPAHLSFAELLHHAGAIPLPPYIKREADANDTDRYQTIYAEPEGSVAAPTAGLHFTGDVFNSLTAKNIQTGFVTLHVGAGTFKPVKAESMGEHEMHAEFIDVSDKMIRQLLTRLDDTIVAVGTTSLRTLESLYWLGCSVYSRQLTVDSRQSTVNRGEPTAEKQLKVEQWEPYEAKEPLISAKEALEVLLQWMMRNETTRLIAKTQIIIAPGYQPRIVKGLITNFHQPQSTLLLLIAALIGDSWKKIYSYALENDFRFLSYGDGCLLWFDDQN